MDVLEPHVLSKAEEKQRGIESEWRFFRALREYRKDWCPWLTKVRWATEQEDSRGIDFVAQTRDVGDIYVQVKSSPGIAEEYMRKAAQGPFDVVIIVIRREYTRAEIFSRARKLLSESRQFKLNGFPHVLLFSPCTHKYVERRS